MMWLGRNTKVLDSFSTQKWEVNACSMRSGYLVLGFRHSVLLAQQVQMMPPSYKAKEIWMARDYTHHNIVRVNCCTCTYFFPKQNESISYQDLNFLFILFRFLFYNRTLLKNQCSLLFRFS